MAVAQGERNTWLQRNSELEDGMAKLRAQLDKKLNDNGMLLIDETAKAGTLQNEVRCPSQGIFKTKISMPVCLTTYHSRHGCDVFSETCMFNHMSNHMCIATRCNNSCIDSASLIHGL